MPAVQTCNTYAFKKLENKSKLKQRISHLLLTDRPGDMLQHMTTCCPLEAQSPIGFVIVFASVCNNDIHLSRRWVLTYVYRRM